jgi:hypothetical protein
VPPPPALKKKKKGVRLGLSESRLVGLMVRLWRSLASPCQCLQAIPNLIEHRTKKAGFEARRGRGFGFFRSI